jgi:hypothetical protein
MKTVKPLQTRYNCADSRTIVSTLQYQHREYTSVTQNGSEISPPIRAAPRHAMLNFKYFFIFVSVYCTNLKNQLPSILISDHCQKELQIYYVLRVIHHMWLNTITNKTDRMHISFYLILFWYIIFFIFCLSASSNFVYNLHCG